MAETQKPIPDSSVRGIVWELVLVTTLLAVVSRLLFSFRGISWIGASLSTIVALLFLYVPTLVMWKRKRGINFLDRSRTDYIRSLKVFCVVSFLIFPPYFFLAHLWQIWMVHAGTFHVSGVPDFWNLVLYQLLLVALPEEFYFRGYFQSTVDRFFARPWNIFGVSLGWGWIVTAFVFTVMHTLVTYRWWHFSIFFPALLFGYLRERTGTITAPILFHAASNILMQWFVRCYQ